MTSLEIVELFSYYIFGMKLLLIGTCFLVLLSSLDDLCIDICFWGLKLADAMGLRRRRYPEPTVERIAQAQQRPLAIMVPAWQESDVIAQMVESAIQTFDYGAYHIFVGCYINDPPTIAEVQRIAERYPTVHKAIVPHDGPTCKADCLNWIIQSITMFEEDNGIEFQAIVMHDSEDVVHPLELQLFNYLLQWESMVQLPVFSLERPWRAFTAGHYLDEFAEYHSKDLKVRELLTGIVPSAGVASGFSRAAIRTLAASNRNILFNTGSLTEDYDFMFRLKRASLSGTFVRFGVPKLMDRRSPFTGRWRQVKATEFVATREYFPHLARAAVRQKARWMLGIGFQGWREVGWEGPPGMRYMLFRDRKAIVTSLLTMLGYFVVVNVVVIHLIYWLHADSYHYPPLVEQGTTLELLVLINLGFLANRLFHRAYFVGRIYGWEQALLSLPRMVWGNLINFFACLRAIRLFVTHVRTGKSMTWDKTAHVFPSLEELRKAPQAEALSQGAAL